MSISVEAREVLSHLNALGYRNVTAEQLKEFIKDLKKLIKYESKIGASTTSRQFHHLRVNSEPDVFDKLHECKTTSIKAKYGTSAKKIPPKDISPCRKLTPRNILKDNNLIEMTPRSILKDKHPANLPMMPKEAASRPQSANTITVSTFDGRKSAQDSARRPKTPRSSRILKSEATSLDRKENRMWIRTKVNQPAMTKTKDPVQLYQFYQKEWERFRQRLPGENDHSELRWQIRHKMLGGGM